MHSSRLVEMRRDLICHVASLVTSHGRGPFSLGLFNARPHLTFTGSFTYVNRSHLSLAPLRFVLADSALPRGAAGGYVVPGARTPSCYRLRMSN